VPTAITGRRRRRLLQGAGANWIRREPAERNGRGGVGQLEDTNEEEKEKEDTESASRFSSSRFPSVNPRGGEKDNIRLSSRTNISNYNW
jgi:hypothetical protein